MVWQSSGFTHDTYLMVCQPIGFTHRRIHRASPRVSGHPVSHIHSPCKVSLSTMHVHWRASIILVRPVNSILCIQYRISDGISANRIHSPSNPSCLAPCLWSPGLAHSLYPYSLSVHYACTCETGTVRRHLRALSKREQAGEQRTN